MKTTSTIGHGLDVFVEFDHHPGRDEVQYGDNPHPEEPAELEVTKIWVTIDPDKYNIIDSLSTEEMELMEDLCWRKVGDDAREAAEDCPDG